MLETGIQAPEFTLPDQNGEMHSLKDYRVVLCQEKVQIKCNQFSLF